jgi:hypothetical protein
LLKKQLTKASPLFTFQTVANEPFAVNIFRVVVCPPLYINRSRLTMGEKGDIIQVILTGSPLLAARKEGKRWVYG